MKDKSMDKSINTSTSTEVKTLIPIAQKISVGIMMAGAAIALFALVFGLYEETYQKPYKEATGQVCPDGRIATQCSCGRIARTPSANYCCQNVYQTTACPANTPNELLLWLPFDGNLLDSSGHNNHASCTSCPAFAAGHIGSATDYSGSQYLNITNSEALNISGAVTIALWINPDVSSTEILQRVVTSPSSFTAPYALTYQGVDNSIIISRSQNSAITRKVTGLTENSWQHVVAGYDASNNPFIYINGVKKTLVDPGDYAEFSSGLFRIGMRQDNDKVFSGLLDDLRVYNKVLSQAEINALAGITCTPILEICSDGIDQDCNGTDLPCPQCSNGQITTRCLCGGAPYTSGYCCGNVHQANACATACDRDGTCEAGEDKFSCAWDCGLVVDHTAVTAFDTIPIEWINAAKAQFKVSSAHTSHGEQLFVGMQMLAQRPGTEYDFSTPDWDGICDNTSFFCNYVPNRDYPTACDALDLGQAWVNGEGVVNFTAWDTCTRAFLTTNDYSRNIIMWSWCGGATIATPDQINNDYLGRMQGLENDYSNKLFVYITGHLDATGSAARPHTNNQLIRTYASAHNGVLYDFADIETYDPNGVSYLDQGGGANADGCQWNNGGGYGSANWCTTWCNAHPGTCPSCSSTRNTQCPHSTICTGCGTCLNCEMKGKAMWWMFARLAGWNGSPASAANTVNTNISVPVD